MPDKALLIGINDYQSQTALRGCLNDLIAIREALVARHFDDRLIREIRNGEAIKRNVLDATKWLVEGAVPGDRVVVHFSGHGSRIRSQDPGEDDGVDELFCLADMSFGDPETYLLDDELAELTLRLPTGVQLTVVLDACHSGTGTRVLDSNRGRSISPPEMYIVRDTARQLRSSRSTQTNQVLKLGTAKEVHELVADEDFVHPRFLLPPPEFQCPENSRTSRRFGTNRSRSASLNHQLLAAAESHQEAADAWIDGQWRGAFTHFLCEGLKHLGSQATTSQIMERTKARLKPRFSQNPQLEGLRDADPLFGIPAETSDQNRPPRPSPERAPTPVENQELLKRVLRVTEKLVNLANQLAGKLEAPNSNMSLDARRGDDGDIVFVHGISEHLQGFSDEWWKSLRPHLTKSLRRHEVVWSDIVNSRSGLASTAENSESRQLREAIRAVLDDRQSQDQSLAASEGSVRGGGVAIDDFLRYMLNAEEREQILARFDRVVRPILAQGRTVHIVSHSWGTVVAWEGLRRLDGLSASGRVANLFVVGSALSISPVRANLFGRIGDGRLPSRVLQAINLDARGDIVGGRISDAFFGVSSREFLDLEPTGCRSVLGVTSPSCSHSSYFDPSNLAVNRDIFARFINS